MRPSYRGVTSSFKMSLLQIVSCKPATLRHRRKIANSLIRDLPTNFVKFPELVRSACATPGVDDERVMR